MDLGTVVFLMFAVALAAAVIGYSLLATATSKEVANGATLLLVASLLVVSGVVLVTSASQ